MCRCPLTQLDSKTQACVTDLQPQSSKADTLTRWSKKINQENFKCSICEKISLQKNVDLFNNLKKK